MTLKHAAAGGAEKSPDAAAAEWFARRDAGLSAEEERALQRWLAEDPRHAEALRRLDNAWSTFGRPARTGEADALLEELARRRGRRRRRAASLAAALTILLAGGWIWRAGFPDNRAGAIPPTAVLRVPEQQVLPDGTRVTLNDGGILNLAFADTERRVELTRGEAHFEVAKDPARPFVVQAGAVAVRAVGTAFSVQMSPAAVEVLVTEGIVAVAGAVESGGAKLDAAATTNVAPGAPIEVTAGKRVVVEIAKPAPPRVTPVDAREIEGRLAWRNPRAEFSGTPLRDAVALLNRESAREGRERIEIVDAELETVRVSGIFRTDNIDGFVLLLEEGFGVDAQRAGGVVELRGRGTRN